jgi:hypothetical protein
VTSGQNMPAAALASDGRADGAAFLASEGGRYLHGAVVMVDGGVTA